VARQHAAGHAGQRAGAQLFGDGVEDGGLLFGAGLAEHLRDDLRQIGRLVERSAALTPPCRSPLLAVCVIWSSWLALGWPTPPTICCNRSARDMAFSWIDWGVRNICQRRLFLRPPWRATHEPEAAHAEEKFTKPWYFGPCRRAPAGRDFSPCIFCKD
jgi:hypothetical protein